jgi:hypothetical protein
LFWKVAGGPRCDAMRTEAIVWDTTLPRIISACWKLKGVDDHEVVVVQGMLLTFINLIKN